ncbi:MAG: hypothetical protein P8X96_02825 [Desulfobacteraceae bacterium]|jgi:hypothetical protein
MEKAVPAEIRQATHMTSMQMRQLTAMELYLFQWFCAKHKGEDAIFSHCNAKEQEASQFGLSDAAGERDTVPSFRLDNPQSV